MPLAGAAVSINPRYDRSHELLLRKFNVEGLRR